MNCARSRTVCGPILAASRRFRVGLAPDSPSLLAASLLRGGGVVIFSSESLRYVSSCARKFCNLCPICLNIIANSFFVCCTAHLKAAPIVGSEPIRIGIESELNRNRIGIGSDLGRTWPIRIHILTVYIHIHTKYTVSLGMLSFEERKRGGTTYEV